MSCVFKKIPIHLLSACTPEGKIKYPQIVVFHAMSAASQHKAYKVDN